MPSLALESEPPKVLVEALVERRDQVDGARTPERRRTPVYPERSGYCANVNETVAVCPVATVTFCVCVPSDTGLFRDVLTSPSHLTPLLRLGRINLHEGPELSPRSSPGR